MLTIWSTCQVLEGVSDEVTPVPGVGRVGCDGCLTAN